MIIIRDRNKYDNMKMPISYDNKITVQLFDSLTKKLKDEVKTHNVMTNGNAKLAYMERYLTKVRGCTSGNTFAQQQTSCYGAAFQSGSAFTSVYAMLFSGIVLANSGLSENADQAIIQGTRVGYAEKMYSYAGTDNMRGSVNLSECSYAEPGNFHYVFDFPTNAANGTFDTIYWGAFSDNLFETMFPGSLMKNNDQGFPNQGYDLTVNGFDLGNYPHWCSYNGICYGINFQTVSEYTVGGLKCGTFIKSTDLTSIIGSGSAHNMVGICVDSNYIYILTVDNKLYKLNKDYSVVSTTTVSNFPTGYCLSYGSCGGLTTYNGNFYTVIYKSGSNPLLAVINSSGVITATKDTGASIGNPVQLSMWKNCVVLTSQFYSSTTAYGFYDATNNLNRIATFMPHDLWPFGSGNCHHYYGQVYDPVKQYWVCMCAYSSDGHGSPVACYLVPPGAMANVSPSVTKTASNTMKVQYDFNIDWAVI